MSGLSLAFGLSLEALYEREGLLRLDALFLERLHAADAALHARLLAARAEPQKLAGKEESELLIALAPPLEDFLAELFGIEAELAALEAAHERLAPLYVCKRLFVQREALRAFPEAEAASFDGNALAERLAALFGPDWDELSFAEAVMGWRANEAVHGEALDLARRYAAWAVQSAEGRARHRAGVLFKAPHKIDPYHLVPIESERQNGIELMSVDLSHAPRRDGLGLTDPGADLVLGLDDANYCIWCHNQGKDSCSKGLPDKQTSSDKKNGGFRKSVFGVTLAGCPLEEKISEMHLLKAEGHPLGALAVICVDNPLCAATGHRVCNDCMKSCIYQRQEPVNIPRSESRILKDAIELPWGVEIYGLLGRWNPLDLRRPLPRAATGYRVLVVGLGPAGFNLAHHLLNDGHEVVAIDGLKIEPLDSALSGVAPDGSRVPFRAIRSADELREPLDTRIMAGFGGLSEYGITVRWDKNYLKIIRLLLERRRGFALHGAARFGGTLDLARAWALGFDHVALCLGAGSPTMLDIPNGLAPGVRAASDFLMALQLGGAGKRDSVTEFQLRLPAVVIGGGLTAGDTATESLAYYPIQVEKFLARYEALSAERGEAAVRAVWSAAEAEIAEEFLGHGRAVRAERLAAAAERRAPRLRELLQSWGGVTIAYRRRLIDSPAYTLNHEEVEKALEEGVYFAECLAPRAIELDASGNAAAIRMMRTRVDPDGTLAETGEEVTLPARAILVAAGTRPNAVLAREDPAHFALDGGHFQSFDEEGRPVRPERLAKPRETQVLVRLEADGRAVSAHGDLHPSFAGNVVKAMGGTKRAYPVIGRLLARRAPAAEATEAFFARLHAALSARIEGTTRLADDMVALTIKAPAAARAWRPGQFFRLQNFESLAAQRGGARLAMEAVAAFPAAIDPEAGTVTLVIAERGAASAIAAQLAPGEPVALLGPNGSPLALPQGGTLLLVGSGYGLAALAPIAQAAREKGTRLLLFAEAGGAYSGHLALADHVVTYGDAGQADTLAEAIAAYGKSEQPIPLAAVDRVLAIGPEGLLAALEAARRDGLGAEVPVTAALLSPMQCMMKEICARCLQPMRDPETGATRLIFACSDPLQPLALADLAMYGARLGQDEVGAKLTRQWLDHCLTREDAPAAPAQARSS
jgi:NADPH-dependent glutamate synthase beta subunit-like oxidoreductase/NAD(P)H-flavin reductase